MAKASMKRKPAVTERPLLEGGFEAVALAEVLEATALGRQPITVEVRDDRQGVLGSIRLKGGMVVGAETPAARGKEAFASLMGDRRARSYVARQVPVAAGEAARPVGPLQELLSAPSPDAHRAAIKESWSRVTPILDTAVDLFYKRLFELRPDLRALFPADMTEQKKKLGATLGFVVGSLDWPARDWAHEQDPKTDLFLAVLSLGQRHRTSYAVKDEHYGPVGEALLWTLEQGLGDAFQGLTREAWTHAYRLLSTTMKLSGGLVQGGRS